MKLSRKQQVELDVITRFIPDYLGFSEPTPEDVATFFAWSDRGERKEFVIHEAMSTRNGLAALYWGKKGRDLMVTSYKEEWFTIWFPYDFVDDPEWYVQWLSKVMEQPSIYNTWRLYNVEMYPRPSAAPIAA